jgi:predicted DNA-binding protein
MNEPTVAIHIPHLLYQRLQHLMELTHRPLESLVLQALDAHIPPLLEDMPAHIRQDLAALEKLEDAALRHVAQSAWSAEQSARYTALIEKERAHTITPAEQDMLEDLYQEANCQMLRKAYANALLKWRGHQLPTLAELETTR